MQAPFDIRMEQYFSFLQQLNQPFGDWRQGELEIITDIALIKAFEETDQDVSTAGLICGAPITQIGIILADKYFLYVRDLVYFPPSQKGSDPTMGSYVRIIYKSDPKNAGVFILPIADGKIGLNLAYRHSNRTFTCEGPGTIARPNESLEAAVERCMLDEFGAKVLKMQLLTKHGLIPERGFVSGKIPLFLAHINVQTEKMDPMISGHLFLSPNEFEEFLVAEEVCIGNRTYIFNDGYTNSAYLRAKLM